MGRSCFMRYVTTKATKRMESYRVRHGAQQAQPCHLLPISFGVSSVSLLHLLDRQLLGQTERTNRTGYQLHVAHIDMSAIDPDPTGTQQLFEDLQLRYPKHGYTRVRLEDILKPKYNSIMTHVEVPSLEKLDLENPTDGERLHRLLGSLPSATSRSDVISIFRTELLVDIAKRHGCESIIWGHSTTRLAEKTLAETAKGRGFSLPWQVSDGSSPVGVAFNYPLRDLLKKELITYSTLTDPPLTPFVIAQPSSARVSASAKNTTIDDLMAQYFSSVEETFPSIVANVVRTSSKLKALPPNEELQTCSLCRMPTAPDSLGIHGWGGDQDITTNQLNTAREDGGDKELCYGCARATLGAFSR